MSSFVRWMATVGVCLVVLPAAAQKHRVAPKPAIAPKAAAAPNPDPEDLPTVALTPPMGWNSWDSYGLTITEPSFRLNVVAEKNKLLPYGWNYAVIDEGWYFENPEDRQTPKDLRYAIDPHGRYVPVPERFPSSTQAGAPRPVKSKQSESLLLAATIENTSFAALGNWVHSQGLKFGIHIMRGIPLVSVERNLPIEGSDFHAYDAANQDDSCPWDPTSFGVRNNEAGQAWYDSIIRQYADWGVDLLKVDCIADHPYSQGEIFMIYRAIKKTGRPMILSLSPGPTSIDHAVEMDRVANMWRISDDLWDVWFQPTGIFPQGVKNQFVRMADWEKYAKPGHWPDADMMPIGELRPAPGWGSSRTSHLTLEEERTQVTLWAIARSPMILGGNLTLLDQRTLQLLTNRDVIAINQNSLKSFEVRREKGLFGWRADMPGGKVAIAIFNVADTPLKLDRQLAEFVGDRGMRRWGAHDVWQNRDLGSIRKLIFTIPPHACVLLNLHRVREDGTELGPGPIK
jgi:alpha-galactosidase